MLNKAFIYNQARKGMWSSKWGLLFCTAGESKEFVGCNKRQAIYKSRHRADLSHCIFYNLNLCYNRRHHIHTHKPDEDYIARMKESR